MDLADSSTPPTWTWNRFWTFLLQLSIGSCALAMSLLAGISWVGATGLLLLLAGALAEEILPQSKLRLLICWLGCIGAACCLLIPAQILFGDAANSSEKCYWTQYYALLAQKAALTLLPVYSLLKRPDLRIWWRRFALTLSFAVTALWMATAYSQNHPLHFFEGVFMGALLLSLWKVWFALPWFALQVVNTTLLVLVGVTAADRVNDYWVRRDNQAPIPPELLRQYYSYSVARQNPANFQQWWALYQSELNKLYRDLLTGMSDPAMRVGLRPNSHTVFVQCPISINSLGFRGREICTGKGSTYRIVALGESTTFGHTTGPKDKPWPELLERLINERLHPARPVEVINAGIPSVSLGENLARFPQQILPLKPDLIVAYHGLNCFGFLDPALAPNRGEPPPAFKKRPLMLLAACEYRIKLFFYRRRLAPRTPPPRTPPSDLLDSELGQNYRELIEIAQTNGIHLAIGNYSMAVNLRSATEVVEFFRPTYPAVFNLLADNAAHSLLVEQLGHAYPQVCVVDTHPHLDGEYDLYLDLVHFAPAGERQLAENFFNGLRPLLQKELCASPASKPSSRKLPLEP